MKKLPRNPAFETAIKQLAEQHGDPAAEAALQEYLELFNANAHWREGPFGNGILVFSTPTPTP